jgi:hypothetical protein
MLEQADSTCFWIVIFLFIAGAWIAMYIKKSKYPMSMVKSSIDGEFYLVRNLPDKQQAADQLAKIREKFLRFIKHLDQVHGKQPIVKQIVKNFDASPDRFTESTPDANFTSYTVNKGEKVYMCLRQRNDREEIVDSNVLMFVALHEMGHIGTASVDHTKEFWNNFAWLLKQAEELGIYKYTDFGAHPVEYCGMHITDSPKYKEMDGDGVLTDEEMKKTSEEGFFGGKL